ncbi:MAG TPA: hypothetical protein VK506_08090, partial [Conexibacter sp.]|nr:hypothetical protein [Conexibacter sp.]
MSRTPEEREAARLERERRRAVRGGRPLPPDPPPAAVPPASPAPEAAPPADARRSEGAERPESVTHQVEPTHDAQATQVFDVTATWEDERATIAVQPAEPEPEPPALAPA